jgi:hypothetical protein
MNKPLPPKSFTRTGVVAADALTVIGDGGEGTGQFRNRVEVRVSNDGDAPLIAFQVDVKFKEGDTDWVMFIDDWDLPSDRGWAEPPLQNLLNGAQSHAYLNVGQVYAVRFQAQGAAETTVTVSGLMSSK